MNLPEPILVTGGGGMLATAFKRLLPQAQCFSRASLDVTDEARVREVISTIQPKLLINCAAYTKVDLAEQEEERATRINGHAVGQLARLCGDRTKLVHFSTDYVFSGDAKWPQKPDHPVGPKSAYGRSKLLGERQIVMENPNDWLILRTAWLYGPGGPNFPQAILNAARAGKPLTVVDDQTGSPTFTFDLAQATLELIDKNAKGIWHVVNDGETTWYDFAAEILKVFNVPANLSRTSSDEWKKTRPHSAVRPAYSVLDITPFERLTGHRTPHWRDALRRYAQSV